MDRKLEQKASDESRYRPIQRYWQRNTVHAVCLIAVNLISCASMLPLASTRVVDSMNFDRYYTDAAVSMLQTNDFVTPRTGGGALRLHKPLLIYWILIGS